MSAGKLQPILDLARPSDRLPVLFIGHGSPMHAITDNPYRRSWSELGRGMAPPRAILCISAHWLTHGIYVTLAERPRTIHDFRGFPDELYAQRYPAPGAVAMAKLTMATVRRAHVQGDEEWGLDHGTWCILGAMFPEARIPVFQLSIDVDQPDRFHVELGKELAFLRERGVLIIASGNIVHNLREMRPDRPPFDWAVEFDQQVKDRIERDEPDRLIDYLSLGAAARLAVPTTDHYLPLLYALGRRDERDEVAFFNESFDLASISMRSAIFGARLADPGLNRRGEG